jgi:hypothetical protein
MDLFNPNVCDHDFSWLWQYLLITLELLDNKVVPCNFKIPYTNITQHKNPLKHIVETLWTRWLRRNLNCFYYFCLYILVLDSDVELAVPSFDFLLKLAEIS